MPPNKPINKKALFDEAIKQMNAGKYGRVSSVLKELLAADPTHQEGRRLFATMHLKLGNLITARAILETLAQEATQRQDHRLAEAVLREYLAAAPRCLPFLELLGQVCEDKGDALAATTEYGKAIEMVLEDPEPDRPTLAADLYVKVKRLAPAGPVTQRFASLFEPPPVPAPMAPSPMEPKVDAQPEPAEPPAPTLPPEPSPVATPPPPKPAPPPPSRKVAPAPPAKPVEPPPKITPAPPPAWAKPAPPPSAKGSPASPPQPVEAPAPQPGSKAAQTPPSPAQKGRASPFRLRSGEGGEGPRSFADSEQEVPETSPTPAREQGKGGAFRLHGEKGPSSLLELLHEGGSAVSSVSPTESAEESEPAETGVSRDSIQTPVEPTAFELVSEPAAPPALEPEPEAPLVFPPQEPSPVASETLAPPPWPVEEPTGAPSIHPVHETWTPPTPEPIPLPPPPVEEPAVMVTLPPLPVESAASMPVLEVSPVASAPVLPSVEESPVMPSLPPVEETWTPPSVQPLSLDSSTAWREAAPVPPPSSPSPSWPERTAEAPPSAPSAMSGRSEPSSMSDYDSSSSVAFIEETAGSPPSLSARLASRLRVDQDEALSIAQGKTPPRVDEVEPSPKPRKARASRKVVLQAKTAVLVGRGVSAVRATARAIMSAVLAVLALITLVIVGPAVLWLSIEESTSDLALNLKQTPARSLHEPKRNGYLLLLGFGADASADPVKEGYERLQKSGDSPGQGCSGADGESRGPLHFAPETQTLAGWFLVADPTGRFQNESARISSVISQSRPLMERYRQWLAMPFEDWGYGQPDSPDCAQILVAHRLYVAEGFHQGMDEGLTRLEKDVAAWRTALGQARTLAVKDMAAAAFNEDLMVVAGLLSRTELRGEAVTRLLRVAQPLNGAEMSLRWPMQNAFVLVSKKIERGVSRNKPIVEQSFLARALTGMPLPKQRVVNGYARFYEAAIKSAESSDVTFPSLHGFTRTPPQMVVDYLLNPIDNYLVQIPKPAWEQYTGMIMETEARVRLVAVQARLRGLSGEGNLLARVAKAGQNFFDPFTGLPMLVNQERKRLYSVGRDRKDDNGDPRLDVSVPIPLL